MVRCHSRMGAVDKAERYAAWMHANPNMPSSPGFPRSLGAARAYLVEGPDAIANKLLYRNAGPPVRWRQAAGFDAMLMVDEAHATGVFGPAGNGLVPAASLQHTVTVCMGTLSKALGGYGGFVACSEDLRL